MKIPVFEKQEVRQILTLPIVALSPEHLAEMLKFPRERLRIRVESERIVEWGDDSIKQPARWRLSSDTPSESIQIEYWAGNRQVEVRRTRPNIWLHLARLHMSIGTGPVWILLSDAMAMALLFLGASGFLLCGKLHGSPRRLALIVTGGLAVVGTLGWVAG